MTARTKTTAIIWHSTATPEGREVTYDDLWRWHVTENRWSDIGYHYLVQLDGAIVTCRPETEIGAHCKGYGMNHVSIGIVYAGGVTADLTPKDTRTNAQKAAMYVLTKQLLDKYGLLWDDVHGHNEYAAKACPSFDVQEDVNRTIDEREDGNVEPNDPDFGAMGQAISALERRVAELEALHRAHHL